MGGDVTGRDKIIQIKAEAGATVYIGQPGPVSVKTDDGAGIARRQAGSRLAVLSRAAFVSSSQGQSS